MVGRGECWEEDRECWEEECVVKRIESVGKRIQSVGKRGVLGRGLRVLGRGPRVLGRGVCWEEESVGKRIEMKRGSSVRKKIESGGKGTFGKRIECWEEYRVCWEEARNTHSVPARRDLQPSLSSGPTWPAVRLPFFISTSSASPVSYTHLTLPTKVNV